MLVKLFNTNQPSVLFLLPVFGAILWIPFFLHPVIADSHIITSYVIVFKKDLLLDNYLGWGLAFAISNLTAIFLNRIINNSDLCNKPSFIYAFAYILFESVLRTNPALYTWQISQLLVVASFWPILQIYNQRNVTNLSFEVGLLIALATLFYEPSIIFLLIVPVFLQVFRPFNWREWLFPMIGFALIFLFYVCYRILQNQAFFTYFLFEKFNFKTFFTLQQPVLITIGIVLAFGLGSYLKGARKAVMHARKQRLVTVFLFLISVATISVFNYSGFVYSNYFLVCALASLFIGYYLSNSRFTWLSEAAFFALLIVQFLKLDF